MKDNGGSWGQFVSMMRGAVPSRWIFIIAVVLSILEAAGGLIVPIFTRDLIDQFATSGMNASVIFWLTGAFVVQAAAGGFSYYMMTYIGETFVRNIRQRLWDHVLKLRIRFFDQHESGELISRVTQDTNTVKTLVTNHLVSSISGIISILGAMIILFIIDWKMTLIMLGAVPISMLILLPLGRLVYHISLQTQDELASFSAGLGRVLSDIRLVKSHNAQSFESQNGKTKIDNLFRFGLKEAKIQAVVSPIMTSVILATLVVLIGYGGARVAAGDLSAGTMVAIIIYMFQIVMPFSMLAQFFTAFQKAMGATERIQELLSTETEQMAVSKGDQRYMAVASGDAVALSKDSPAASAQQLAPGALATHSTRANSEVAELAARHGSTVHEAPATATMTVDQHDASLPTQATSQPSTARAQSRSTRQALSAQLVKRPSRSPRLDWHQPLILHDVSFSYGDDTVLQHLNVVIEPGSTVAFVGPSGAGKTTIFSLLERFYEPTQGRIILGDVPIDDIPLLLWREGIGYVPQESPIMSGTIRSNLTYGLSRSVSDTEMKEAATQANAASFIEAQPERYETEVGERGIKLSGGQRQRIAIARALLRDPKLLLLDEATSNLDSESEALVQEALVNLMRGRTTLIIAHRLSTVIGADHIVFLEKGVITGQGTHEQLMSTHELYQRFVRQQMSQHRG